MQDGPEPNVVSGDAISIRDLAQVVVEELAPSPRVEVARVPLAGEPRFQYVPDIHSAERCLGLRHTIGLRKAIRRTAAWHR